MALKVLLEQEKAFRTIVLLLAYLVSQVFPKNVVRESSK